MNTDSGLNMNSFAIFQNRCSGAAAGAFAGSELTVQTFQSIELRSREQDDLELFCNFCDVVILVVVDLI